MRIASQESNLKRLSLIQGLLIGLSPLPFLLYDVTTVDHTLPEWVAIVPFISYFLLIFTVFYPFRNWEYRRIFNTLGLVLTATVLYPILFERPDISLGLLVIIAIAHLTLFDQKHIDHYSRRETRFNRYNISLKTGIISFSVLQAAVVIYKWPTGLNTIASSALVFSALVVAIIFFIVKKPELRFITIIANILWAVILVVCIIVFPSSYNLIYVLLAVFLILLPLDKHKSNLSGWLAYAVDKPARVLVLVFLAAGLIGSFVLYLPFSHTQSLSWLDTFFTAISAVCVTGLIVVDTPVAYTAWGQVVILILIQLGGLGIMSVSIILLRRLGRRISVSHEQVMATITDADKRDIFSSIRLILVFTFIAELVGAILLSAMFFRAGDELGYAVWRGLFTSISAFCNAGFALQSDSLMSYTENSGVLMVVSTLIILGGISPLSTLLIFKKKSYKSLNAALKLSLLVVMGLLVVGTLSTLLFEWNETLSSMTFGDKITNAWFQSVTLRTAGFNSIDQSLLSTPTYMMSLVWMVIGGSPGGTAGGVKTAVVGLILLNFFTQVNQKRSMTFSGRVFPIDLMLKAVSIVTAYGFILSFALITMLLTQNIPFDYLLFEVVSALSTVGLSMGATNMIDSLGKWILIFTMFIGRVGAVTIFMMLSREVSVDNIEYPKEQMTLA